jgi:hypothetical protein
LPLSTKSLRVLPLITVWPQVRVLPRPPILACSASYGTAGHPASRELDIADRTYVLDQGGVVYHAAAHELLADNDIKETLLLSVIRSTDSSTMTMSRF